MSTTEAGMDARTATRGGMATLTLVLAWPVIALLITGGWHLTIEAIWPDLRNFFVPTVLAPVLLAYGAWAGFRAATATGSFVTAIVAGVILGVLPFTLQLVGFGLILGRGLDNGLLAAVFASTTVVWGALLGGGFAKSRHGR